MDWRYDLGLNISERLETIPSVAAVLVGGSVARGWVDEYSDLEIGVFWTEAPHERDRKVIARDIQAEFLTPFEKFNPGNKKATGTEDNLLIKGFQVDLCHNMASRVEEATYDVMIAMDTNQQKQMLLANVRKGKPLHGSGLIEKWAKELEFPRDLAVRIINENLPHLVSKNLETSFVRKDWLLFQIQTTNFLKRVFNVLYAANSELFVGYKHLLQLCKMFAVKPPGFEEDLVVILAKPPVEAKVAIDRLLSSTLNLVKDEFPEVELAKITSEYSYMRKAFSGPPEGMDL